MSMLADRKVKQKWSLNPRGKIWSDDSNKFGQKMLEKMGWTQGKGLGAKENGIVEHLKVSYKNDSKGMGFKDRNDQWTEHDSNFNSLLQSLSGETQTQTNTNLVSLEQKSQKSKVRVHYQKFTRGKDLTRYSEKDLANIFGKKSLTEVKLEKIEEDAEPVKESKFIYNGGSMLDYFKKKLPSYAKRNDYVVGSNGVLRKESEGEEGRKRKFNGDDGNGTPKKIKQETEIVEEKGLSNLAFDPLFNNVGVQKSALNTICEENEGLPNEEYSFKKDKKNKKKKSKEDKNEKTSNQLNNKDSENKLNNEDSEVKKKKKQWNRSDSSIDYEENGVNSGKDEQSTKKKKSKEINNLATNTTIESEDQNMDDEEISSYRSDVYNGDDSNSKENKSAKKKKKKTNNWSVDNPTFNAISPSDNSHSSYMREEFEVTRAKKKTKDYTEQTREKRKENCSMAIDNPVFNANSEQHNAATNEDFEVKRKTKKKKNRLGSDNPTFNGNENGDTNHINDTFEVKRKKMKKEENSAIDNPAFQDPSLSEAKKKKNRPGNENPAFNVTENGETNHLNDTFEVRRIKKNKKDKLAIDNPGFQDPSVNEEEKKKIRPGSDNTAFGVTENPLNETFEVKRKKMKKEENLAIDNPGFQDLILSEEPKIEQNETFDLMLNVTSTPVVKKIQSSNQSSSKRKKSVRFSDVRQERIIPNNEDLEKNELFDINSRVIENGLKDSADLERNVEEMSRKIEGFQAEIENDMNAAKARCIYKLIDHTNMEVMPGQIKLKHTLFKRSNHLPNYYWQRSTSKAKASYKHLIKGDVILHFNNSNLHEIEGYSNTPAKVK